MLRRNEVAFIKALSTMKPSPALLKELRLAVTTRRKKTTVLVGIRSTTPGVASRSLQLPGKRKASEPSGSGDSSEPAARRPTHEAGFAPLPFSSVTGELAATSSRQLGPPEVGSSYAAVLAASVAYSQPSGTLKPTAMDSDMSESAASSEAAKRRMSSDMPGHLSGTPDGISTDTQVTNTCLPAGQRPTKTPIFIAVHTNTCFSWPGCGRPVLAV
jgi:hypothetical protein